MASRLTLTAPIRIIPGGTDREAARHNALRLHGKCPGLVEFQASLPMTPSGKVARYLLS